MAYNEQLHQEIEVTRRNGLAEFNLYRSLFYIILPCVAHLVIPLFLPYIIASAMSNSFSFMEEEETLLYRYSYHWFALFFLSGFLGKRLTRKFWALHDAVRDDRYLVRRSVEDIPPVEQEQT